MSQPMVFIDKTIVRSITCDGCNLKEILDLESAEYLEYAAKVSKKTRNTYASYFQRQGWRVDPYNTHLRYCPECGKRLGILIRRRKL